MDGAGSRRFTKPTQLAKMRTNTTFSKEISHNPDTSHNPDSRVLRLYYLVRRQCVSNRLPIGAAPLRKPKFRISNTMILPHSAGTQALRAHRNLGGTAHCLDTTKSRPPCAVSGRTTRTGARLWWPRRSHNPDTNGERGEKRKGNHQPAPVRRTCSQSTRSTRLSRAPP